MKKFYHLVAVNRQDGGYAVLLDGKPVKTSTKKTLLAPTQKLADAIAAEWIAQADTIKPDTMPLTQFLMTFLDKVEGQRDVHHAEIMNYLDTDLLCYRSEKPSPYADRQSETWDPVLAWFEQEFGVRLETTTSLVALRQNEQAHNAVEAYISGLSEYDFMVLRYVTGDTGSLVLALAFLHNAFKNEQIIKAAHAEELLKSEIYLADIYGDAPDQEKKRASQLESLNAARVFIDTARTG